jgi:hypothetical protein
MEVLNGLFHLEGASSYLQPLRAPFVRHRMALYVDDVVIFIAPAEQDILIVKEALSMFVEASSLHTNMSKCQLMPIHCTDEHINQIQSLLPCQLVQFPGWYLGVPLSVHTLGKADIQSLVDSVADRIPTWKGGLMSRAGQTTLTKVTLSAIPIHISIVVKVSPWIYRAIN